MLAVFRVDSGLGRGAGHLGRCSILAQELHKKGFDLLFVSRENVGAFPLSHYISEGQQVWIPRPFESGLESLWPKEEQLFDAQWIQKHLLGRSIDVLVVDHYGLDHHFEKALPARCVLAFDDLYEVKHSADFILNQAGTEEGDYKSKNQKSFFRELLGPQYALVSQKVRQVRNEYQLDNCQEGVLYFGSGQVGEPLKQALKGLQDPLRQWGAPLTVILNDQDPHFSHLQSLSQESSWFQLRSYVQDFPELLKTSRFFIGANGATSWERCCIGVPTISFSLAKNQYEIEKTLKRSQAAVVLGPWGSKSLEALPLAVESLKDRSTAQLLSKHSRSLCDGHGAERIVSELLQFGLS